MLVPLGAFIAVIFIYTIRFMLGYEKKRAMRIALAAEEEAFIASMRAEREAAIRAGAIEQTSGESSLLSEEQASRTDVAAAANGKASGLPKRSPDDLEREFHSHEVSLVKIPDSKWTIYFVRTSDAPQSLACAAPRVPI